MSSPHFGDSGELTHLSRMPKGIIVKTILQGGGFNWVLIDAEHGQITDHDYHEASSSVATAPRLC